MSPCVACIAYAAFFCVGEWRHQGTGASGWSRLHFRTKRSVPVHRNGRNVCILCSHLHSIPLAKILTGEDMQSRSNFFSFAPKYLLTRFHNCQRPVNAFSEALLQQEFSDVSLWVQDGADKVAVAHRFQDHFDVFLQQSGLDAETGLLRKRLGIAVLLYRGALQAKYILILRLIRV